MRNVIIDCFGNRNDLNPERFNSMSGKKHSHLIDEASETVTYIAFDHAEKAAQPIHKIVVDGTVTTILWGYGAWANRTTIEYDLTKNETRTVEVAD